MSETGADGRGRAQFPVHMPPPALRRYVAAAHGYRVPANPTGLHRGLPSRRLTLVVELLAPLHLRGGTGQVSAHGVLGGLHVSPVLIDAGAPQEGVQYALTALGAQACFGLPASALRDRSVDLVDLLGPDGRRLVEQLCGTTRWAERFALLDAALLARLRRLGEAPVVAPQVAEAWRVLFSTGGRVRVGAVAAHVGWSHRHLSERFRSVTGIAPSEAVRIARFESARRLLLAADRPALADVAAMSGFADQAHLAREWRALAGCTVTTWLREEFPFVQDAAVRTGAHLPA